MEIMSSNPSNPGAAGSYADKLTIETPEQTALEFAVAGIGSRFLALAFDTQIQTAVGIVVGIAGSMATSAIALAFPRTAVWAFAFLVLFFFSLYFGYFALFEIIWNGQTPGKRKVGIRVIKDSGRPLTPAETIGRNLMRIVDWLPFLYGVGITCAFLNKENKRLGDLVVGSLVVRETSFSELKPAWQGAMPASNLAASPLGAMHLSPEEFALIDSYLNRRLDLDPDVRYRMADEIFRRIRSKLTVPADSTLSVDRIL